MKILIGGSRSGAPLPVVRSFVAQALKAGFQINVGCACGADQAAIQACLALGAPSALSVFAVGAPGGAGFWSGSACSAVRQAAARGASVQWLAGGPLSVPLFGRLAARSRACLAGCGAAVFFCAPGGSKGSFKTAAVAVNQGINVFVFCSGGVFPPALPGVSGQWVPAPLFGVSFWEWVSDPILKLF
jgi:predicted Rossmann fold nucleotide-binding protein DprA/Smf involved in DNA uptake